MNAASTTRDRILDALQEILIHEGSSAVTLEAVATAAGVSKGGLLYHFPSKAAMLTGLVRRLTDQAADEFREARAEPGGVVRTFLRVSVPTSAEETALYSSVIAALRGNEDVPPEAWELMQWVFTEWGTLLHEEIGDPVLAETVRLVGDGLYLSAMSGLPMPDPLLLERVTDHLIALADEHRRNR
ncbi:TetR/AcrR family transcriptional regulator [Marinitenerispora sediminis]|uniref:TetR/AcrR family transcriptional regulator n=1 Tax=Marinitenerispora sediminis TaxID=1931232 RepID=A0A368T385_9ACTN|nr:TetR/AcrR family transcriptional regulator [Marinitenerispora sediminis]RCV47573.1 TetR/AcrR family transcriptional regulator [Marinitenerispora sediminis]RCV47833.1 TetR/AcrR family transcriptional regulator [Marinitenerispora sediminis]RCV56862.1 TetR/AcrR family transcriptional regulator [Marinitenerispora sediminis]